MLQELRATVADATATLAEIADRLKIGDPATDAIERLRVLLATVTRNAPADEPLPDDLRSALAALLTRLAATITGGAVWLNRAAGELDVLHTRQRLNRAYGVT